MNASIDRRWMLRGILTGALTAGAAASVAATPAISATEAPDPVFGLLEAHKAAWARLLATEDCTDDHEELEEAGGAVDAALDRITTTPPTTVAGMRAVMEYLVELDGHSDYLPTLLRSSILRSPLLADKACGTGIASA
jgi:hypothetical protein